MNNDPIKGRSEELGGKLHARRGEFTGDLQIAGGNTGYLVEKVQERYGIPGYPAEKQVGDCRA